jgi:chromosome segregation ATPase
MAHKSVVQVERNGKTYTVNSYSLLQDRYHNHMKEMGFDGFERGSTTEHLEVLDYKIQQDTKRSATLDAEIETKKQTSAELDVRNDKKTARLTKLDEQIANREKAKATIAEIDAMGKPAILGGFNFTINEAKTLKTLAKKSVSANKHVAEANRKLKIAEDELAKTKSELAAEKKKRPSISENLKWFDKFLAAMRRAPKRLMAVIEDILRSPPEQAMADPARSLSKSKTKENQYHDL